jgi:hypothetical protein
VRSKTLRKALVGKESPEGILAEWLREQLVSCGARSSCVISASIAAREVECSRRAGSGALARPPPLALVATWRARR